MSSSPDINQAWKTGYIKGWNTIFPTIPSIPARPASVPAGVTDTWKYFHDEGYKLGRYNAGLAK
jgi:hypothetical protein